MGLVYIVYGVTGLQKHGRAQKLKPMVVKQIPINDFDKAGGVVDVGPRNEPCTRGPTMRRKKTGPIVGPVYVVTNFRLSAVDRSCLLLDRRANRSKLFQFAGD